MRTAGRTIAAAAMDLVSTQNGRHAPVRLDRIDDSPRRCAMLPSEEQEPSHVNRCIDLGNDRDQGQRSRHRAFDDHRRGLPSRIFERASSEAIVKKCGSNWGWPMSDTLGGTESEEEPPHRRGTSADRED